ncbi:MAG TPA: hypothetical protein VMP38_03495, partial [Candidatus Acidoferrum sp.]|nr:hypothetical protein [Candidatus Acidoferrum sp.]
MARADDSLALERPRRPGAILKDGAEAVVKGPGDASSRIAGCAPPLATLSSAPAADVAQAPFIANSRHGN